MFNRGRGTEERENSVLEKGTDERGRGERKCSVTNEREREKRGNVALQKRGRGRGERKFYLLE